MPSIFLPGSLEGRGPYRNCLRYRRIESYRATPATRRIFAPTACVAVEGFRAILAIEYDGIHWRGFAPGGLWRGFFVGRIGSAWIVIHAGTITLQVLIRFLAPISRAAIPAALYVWRLAPVRLV